MIRLFSTRRALLARNADLEAIVAKQIDQLAERDETIGWLNDVMSKGAAADAAVITGKNDQIRRQAKTIKDMTDRLAAIHAEAASLREDIRREEQAEQPVGIMRTHNRPMPWQQHDAIRQDAEAKRLADGAED